MQIFNVQSKQETQLSQRPRALRVAEYFAESLMFTQGHPK